MGGDRGEYIHSLVSSSGKNLANCIGDELLRVLGQQKKVYAKAGSSGNDYYHVIRETAMEAVIVEVCFIDNKNDVQIADTVAEQERNGVLIAHGILKHYGIALRGDTTSSVPSVPSGTIYRAVVGSYTDRAKANARVEELKKVGFSSFLDAFKKDGVDYLRVICGSFKERANVEARINELKAKGYNDCFIAIYNGAVETPAPPKPAPAPADPNREIKRYTEHGRATVTAKHGIRFRDKPSTSSGVVKGSYGHRDSVVYDLVVITEGYTWISWIGASSGARRYMPIVDRKANERWATCV